MNSGPETPREWAELLKREWDQRARSPVREFFVASGPDWEDPEIREREARIGVEFALSGADPVRLAESDVLEIGCGSGRLVPHLAAKFRHYTGIDISDSMVCEATRRCSAIDNARFFESDGLTLPAAVKDREYGQILAFAVFIHCPKPVIASLLREAHAQLAAGGEIRFQVFADLGDLDGIDPECDLAAMEREAQSRENVAPAEAVRLIQDHYYEGHRFGVEELRTFARELIPDAEIEIHRPHPVNIWGVLGKPPAAAPR